MATSVTNDQILNALYAVAPQFKTTDSDTLARYATLIGYLRCQVYETRLCCNAVLAYAYLLAAMLSTLNSGTGVITDMQEGELTIKYAVSPTSSWLNATSYGRMYLDLVKRTVFAPFVTQGYYVSGTIGTYPYGY